MRNRVGSVVPSEAEIQRLVRLIQDGERELEKATVTLTPEERQRTLKPRREGAEIAELLGTVAEEKGLSIPGASVADMRRDFTLARRLRPLAQALALFERRIEDTILEAESEGWFAATAIYSTLSRVASTDASVGTAIEPAVELFSRGVKKGGQGRVQEPGPTA